MTKKKELELVVVSEEEEIDEGEVDEEMMKHLLEGKDED